VSKICAKTTHVVVSMAVYTIGFFVLRDAAWCYLWDLLSIVIMGLLMYGIIADKRPGYFVALFFVEALNHNAALIVAIFVLCRALTFERDKRRIEFDYKWLGLGLLLVLFSFAIPYTVTAALYKHELGPSIWHGPSSAGIGYLGVQFDLWLNLRKLFTPRYLSTRHVFLLILFVISVVFLRVRALSKCNWFATLVPLGVYWLSQLLFAVCVEWRIWLPFLALSTVQLAWLLNNRDVAATKLPRQRPPQSLESVSPEA
jgi:hypothetical protein